MNIKKEQFPQVMGILNITPDSFFVGSRKQTEKEIAERVIQIMEEGANIIDVGGYSSRPNAAFVSEEIEMERLRFGLKILFREAPKAIVSVDTFRSNIAVESVERFGATIINDISAGEMDNSMFNTIARLQVVYIIMHMHGTPQTMMENIYYNHLVPDMLLYFADKINRLRQKGVNDILVDPGYGFSKTTIQNYEVLYRLEQFSVFDLPILVGFSRKTMIREVIGVSSEEALNGTTALNMYALTKGADILRVHDVKEAVQAVRLYKAITKS